MKATKTQSDRLASTSGRARGKHMDAYSFRWLAGNPPLRGTRLQFGEGHSVLGELLRRGSDPVGGPGRKAAFWSRRFVVSRRSERGIWSANNQILSVLYIYIYWQPLPHVGETEHCPEGLDRRPRYLHVPDLRRPWSTSSRARLGRSRHRLSTRGLCLGAGAACSRSSRSRWLVLVDPFRLASRTDPTPFEMTRTGRRRIGKLSIISHQQAAGREGEEEYIYIYIYLTEQRMTGKKKSLTCSAENAETVVLLPRQESTEQHIGHAIDQPRLVAVMDLIRHQS